VNCYLHLEADLDGAEAQHPLGWHLSFISVIAGGSGREAGPASDEDYGHHREITPSPGWSGRGATAFPRERAGLLAPGRRPGRVAG
jgi:hypothetical protein